MDYQTYEAILLLAIMLGGGSLLLLLAAGIAWLCGVRDPRPMATYNRPRTPRELTSEYIETVDSW